jgi:predicted flap endonuclease-1-like 5' DNA nuclease
MTTIFEANLVPILIAFVIGFVIGWWMFRRARPIETVRLDVDQRSRPYLDQPDVPPPTPVLTPEPPRKRPIRDGIDTHEKRGVMDQGAAATADVAGQLLSIHAHAELPGADVPADNLQMLKGVGPKLAQKLNDNGIFRFEQLAGLGANEVAMLEERLGPFRGRLSRDRVVEQASYLARGDTDGFEARFGRLGGPA